MGFLDRLKLSGDDNADEALPAPPKKGTAPEPPKDLPPLPAQEPQAPVSNLPAQDAPVPKLEVPEKIPEQDLPPPLEPVELAASPEEKPQSLKLPEGPADSDVSAPQPPEEPLQKDAPAHESVPPPPAPQKQDRSVRSVSDIPPIKVDPSQDKQGIITDRHVEDLNVDNLRLPGEREETSITQAPEKALEQKPVPKSAPGQDQQRAYTGPLYVDVPTYEEVQQHLSTLKKNLASVSADVEALDRLNQQEAKEFESLVNRLEHIQDRVLGIDKSLFEEQ